jgi:hypothetical protein
LQYIKDKYDGLRIKVFFTRGVDVEKYFCNEEHLIALNPSYEKEVRAAFIKSISECQDDFRKKALNGKNSIRNFLHNEGLSTLGKQDCEDWSNNIDYMEERWQHGKILLKALNRNFRNLTSNNLKVFEPTDYLHDNSLKELLGINEGSEE